MIADQLEKTQGIRAKKDGITRLGWKCRVHKQIGIQACHPDMAEQQAGQITGGLANNRASLQQLQQVARKLLCRKRQRPAKNIAQ